MASLYKRGRIWWTKFYHRGQTTRKSLRTANRQLARERARLLETSIKDGMFVLRAACTRTPLSTALDDYCRHLRTSKTSKSSQTDIYYLRQLFGPAAPGLLVNSRKPISHAERERRIASMRPRDLRPGPEHLRITFVEDLTTAEVSKSLAQRVRERGLSPKTGNRLREVLHRLCSWCASQRGVRFPEGLNPVSAVDRFRERTPEIRFLTVDQIGAQFTVLKPYPTLHAMVAVLIYAGVRREEMIWLTHDDVDLDARLIRVRAKTLGGEFWEPKTKRNRAVPISASLMAILAEYRPNRRAPWYFTSPRGCRWDPDNFSAALRRINQLADLPWSCLDFRHTFGSQLAQRGVSLFKISELMGNSPQICRLHYAALVPEQMADVVEFVGAATNGDFPRVRIQHDTSGRSGPAA